MTMTIGGFGSTTAFDQQTFGASVVSKTLDYMNGSGGSSAAPTDKQTFGAAVVSKTMDYMNQGTYDKSGMSQSYQFQTDVLGGYAKGSIVNSLI